MICTFWPLGVFWVIRWRPCYGCHEPPFLVIADANVLTFAFFTSAGVASSNRCDIFVVLLKTLRLLTLSIGVLTLK